MNKNIFSSIVLLAFLLGNTYISGVTSGISFIVSIVFYGLFFYVISFLWNTLRRKKPNFYSKENFLNFIQYFLHRISVFFLIIGWIVGSFSYYQNEISPAMMPTYTISNWEKTVIFQAMSHIASQNFYDSVKKNIFTAKSDGYTYYFEWVKPGSKENEAKFNKALGVEFDKNLYENMSKMYGLVNQNNADFLWLVNDKDKNVDISLDEVVKKYESLKKEKNISREYESPLPASQLLTEELSKLSEKELTVLRYINKAMINAIMKSDWVQQWMLNNFSNKELFAIILDGRNEVLANEILTSNDTKIITTYGLLHFDWVLKLLQQKDIKWQITKIDYTPVTK